MDPRARLDSLRARNLLSLDQYLTEIEQLEAESKTVPQPIGGVILASGEKIPIFEHDQETSQEKVQPADQRVVGLLSLLSLLAQDEKANAAINRPPMSAEEADAAIRKLQKD